MDGFTIAEKDVVGMCALLRKQQEHFKKLAHYASSVCGDTTGLNNLMSVLAPKVEELAGWCSWRLRTCESLVSSTITDLEKTLELYRNNDQESRERLLHLFADVDARVPFVELGSWAAALHSSYDDDWDAAEPPPHDDAGTGKLIDDRRSGLIADCEEIWALGTPDRTLVDTLITPITGDYGRLYWLKQAYDALGNSTYSIAENLRSGTIKIGAAWNGPAAKNFEYHMFEWHEGTGGLADLFELCSQAFQWLLEQIMVALGKILDWIQDLIYRYFPSIKEILDRNPGSFDAISCAPRTSSGVRWIGGDVMPESDIKLFMKRMSETAKFVNDIKKMVNELETLYEKAKEKIGKIWDLVGKAGLDPAAYLKVPVERGQQRVVDFERHGAHKFDPQGWNPAAGVWRVALLPQL